jgi:hypothetical protein
MRRNSCSASSNTRQNFAGPLQPGWQLRYSALNRGFESLAGGEEKIPEG